MPENKNLEESLKQYVFGKCDGAELQQVIDAFKDPDKDLQLRSLLYGYWENNAFSSDNFDDGSIDYEFLLGRIHQRINHSEAMHVSSRGSARSQGLTLLSRVAAILFIPMFLTSLWFLLNRNEPAGNTSVVSVSTPMGATTKTVLPDGTEVWQNAGSNLTYESNFSEGNREVFLSGEAFFHVKANTRKPFYVKTREGLVKVTGTKFNVSAYDEDNYVSVVLESGKLSFHGMEEGEIGDEAYILAPGDRLVYYAGENAFFKDRPAIEKYTSWKDGKLIFRNDPFHVLIEKLSRWYHADIVILDESNELQDHPFTLTIENETLPQVLEYLSRAAPMEFEVVSGSKSRDGSLIKRKYLIRSK